MANYRLRAGRFVGIVAVIVGLLSFGLLSGCGQKGPLYLPDEKEQQERDQQKKKKAETKTETETETETSQ
jgi:predicted small lipoprotein YifL